MKDAVDEPAATVRLAGRVAARLLLVSNTVAPLGGAAFDNVTVQATVAPPATVDELQPTPASCVGAVTVRLTDCDEPPYETVIIAI